MLKLGWVNKIRVVALVLAASGLAGGEAVAGWLGSAHLWTCTCAPISTGMLTCTADQYGKSCSWNDSNNQSYSVDYVEVIRQCPSCTDTTQPMGSDPHPSLPVSGSSSTATAAAVQPSIDTVVAASNQTAIQQIQGTAGTAQIGDGQTRLLKSADEVNQIGANQAATVAALYCADAANKYGNDPEAAGADYAKCGQYFTAAKTLNANGAGYKADDGVLSGDAAKSTLDGFEKNFGVSGSDYLGRMLGADGGRDALGGLVGDKISAEKLASAAESADGRAAAKGDDAFVVDLSRGAKPAVSELREALKAKLAAASEKKDAREPASAARVIQEGPENQFDGLSPLREGVLAASDESSKELTLFDVVHDKYAELRQRWAETRKLR